MREPRMSIPELVLVAATRAMLGAGLGLLLAGKLSHGRRIAAGTTLLAIGALSTIPLGIEIFGRGRRLKANAQPKNGMATAPMAD